MNSIRKQIRGLADQLRQACPPMNEPNFDDFSAEELREYVAVARKVKARPDGQPDFSGISTDDLLRLSQFLERAHRRTTK